MFTVPKQSSSGYKPYTGLAAFKVLAVNPTKSQIEDITGREYPIEVNYDVRQDLNGNDVKPVEFWVETNIGDTFIRDRVTFQISRTEVLSQAGNKQFINKQGQSRYGKTIEEANANYEKLAPFVRPMTIGEDSLYAFMQRCMGYKPSEPDANFLEECEKAGITVDKIYAGDLSGLNNFIKFINDSNRKVGLVLAVKQKEKALEDGTKVTQNRQVILNNSDYFFTLPSGKITDYNIKRFQEVVEEKEKNNISLGSALFTFELKEFSKNDCVNSPSENPAVSTDIKWG